MALLDFVRDYPGGPAPERWNQEGKTNLDLLEHETVSGSGIRWAICKCAPWPRHNHASIPPLQINDFIILNMLPFIPLHFLFTHFWQKVHCIELLPTPLPQIPHGHLAAFCITFSHAVLIITLVLFIFTLMPQFIILHMFHENNSSVLDRWRYTN